MDHAPDNTPAPLDLYRLAVQHPLAEVGFIERCWSHYHGDDTEPLLLREDFAGTCAVAAAWCASDPDRQAMAVEIDRPTAEWAAARFDDPDLHIVVEDVMSVDGPAVDVTAALNFSVLIYHDRLGLLAYLRQALAGLRPGGLLVLDLFGGTGLDRPRVVRRRVEPDEGGFETFDYTWEQGGVDAVSRRVTCRVHFDLSGGRRFEGAFIYDWRLWSADELIALAGEAGFAKAELWAAVGGPEGRYGVVSGDPGGPDWVAYVVCRAPWQAGQVDRNLDYLLRSAKLVVPAPGAQDAMDRRPRDRPTHATRTRHVLILIIAGGPDKGRIYELNNDAPIVLGREGDQVKLNDRKVSREHARLWCEGGQWYLEDLGSRHGTYRNHTLLECTQRAKLKDGDYLQIGNTVMVLGRMPAEHAERLSLLAGQSAAPQAGSRRPMMIAAGVSVAALLGLGAYIAAELNSLRGDTVPRDEFVRLQQDLIAAQRDSTGRIEASLERNGSVSRELLTHQRQLSTTLDETTRAINRHGAVVADAANAFEGAADPIIRKIEDVNAVAARQQLAIERIGEMLAHQQANDASPRLLAAVSEMKQLLSDQPLAERVAERLEQAIQTNAEAAGQAVKLALAEHNQATTDQANASAQQTDKLLSRVLEQLAQVPTREQIAEQVRLAVAESKVENEQFMRLVLAELRRTGDQITTDVAAAIDEDTGQAQALAEELRAIDNESAAKTAALLESVLSRVSDQQKLASQIASLREQIEALPGRDSRAVREVLARLDAQDRNNSAMLGAIAELRAAMPENLPGRLDQVLAQLDKQVRTEQLTDAIEQAMQRVASARDEQTRSALASFSERLDALPSAKELSKIADSQQALAKLLDESDAREAVGELRAALERLSSELPQGRDDKLAQVIAMLKQREKAELLLAELHDELGNQSAQTETLKKELLEAITQARDEETGQTLRELLGLVRDRLMTDESVRQAVRDELRGTVLPNQMSLNDARDVTTSASPNGDPEAGDDDAQPGDRLTRLEKAYKQSFETGQPITVGAGVVDPDTGRVSEGRLIDPAVAKDLGFETWRDWYLTDRHAEQMRLQQQALLQRNAHDAQDPDTIELPSPRTDDQEENEDGPSPRD